MSAAERVKARLDAGFRYKADASEHWQSLAELARTGAAWSDDCDGYALTAAELLVKDEGLDPDAVAICFCKVRGAGHLICLVTIGGTTYVVDNIQRAVWDWNRVAYEYVSAMRLGEKVWREIKRNTHG